MNVIYFLIVENMDKKQREELDSLLIDTTSSPERRRRVEIAAKFGEVVPGKRS